MVVKLRVKDQLLDNDFEIVKKTFLEKIEQITHESGLSRLVNANELLAVFEYDDDQDPTDAQPKTSSKRGRKLVGIYSVVLKRDYISKDRQPITILKRLITDVKKHFTRNEDSKDGESLLQGVDITLPGVNLDIEESNDKSIIKSEFGGKGLVMDTYKFEGRSFENANEKDTDFESVYIDNSYYNNNTDSDKSHRAGLKAKIKKVKTLTSDHKRKSYSFKIINKFDPSPTFQTEHPTSKYSFYANNLKDENVKSFSILLRISRFKNSPMIFKQEFKNKNSQTYKDFKQLAEQGINVAFKLSNLSSFYIGSKIENIHDASDINPEWSNSILLNFSASFEKSYMGYQDQVFKSLIDSIISTSFKVGDSELYVINQELMPTGPKVSIVSEVRRTGDGLTYQFNQSEQTQKSYYSKFEAHEDILTDNSNTKIPDISRQRPSTIVPLSVTIDGQTYSQCSVDQKLLLGCLDSESTCLVKETSQSQGFSNNGEAECVCQEGFSQRLWSAPKNEADILGVRGAIGDKKKCYKYQRVTTGFRLSLSDIYKYDLSVKSTEFINPNNIFSKTISDQITKMFLKSPLRRYFLKIKIESVVPYQNPLALVASGSVIFSFTIRCSLYLDIELQATEEEIHNRFSQEFALNKENYDALGWKIQVFPYSQTNEERYLSPPSPNTRNPQKPNIVIKPAPVVFVSQKNSPKVSLSDYDEDTVLTQKQGFINDTGFLKVSFGKRPSTNATCKLGTSIGCGFNEECILNTGQTICRCLFGFARKADSIECIAQKTLDVQLRIDSIRNISIVEIYNKSLLDRTDSKFVTFMMEELNAFLSDSEHAIYIIEARFNNLAKINYEKDLKTQHVLVNFTLVIKNSFEGYKI
ncbi:unnamed protein product [Gordionus sp. m RMFG-2023]